MPYADEKWRNEWMRRHRAARIYALPDNEQHPLRVWRKVHGMTMVDAARILDVTPTSVRNWEVGISPTPSWVTDLINTVDEEYLARKIAELKAPRIYADDNELRRWRKLHGMPQEEIGFVVDRSRKTIEKWETGQKPTPEWVMKKLEEYDARLNEENNLRYRRMDQLFADAGPRGGL